MENTDNSQIIKEQYSKEDLSKKPYVNDIGLEAMLKRSKNDNQ